MAMKSLGLVVTLVALSACLAAQSAPAVESATSASTSRDFKRPCKLPPAEEKEASGPGIILPRFTPANPPRWPGYPKGSRERGEYGTLHMLVLVNEKGRASQVKLVKSTGYPALDQVGLDATRDWKIAPGTVDGKVQCMWRVFEFSWTLDAAGLPREAVLLADAMLVQEFFRARLVATAEKKPQSPAVIECFRNADLTQVRDAHANAFSAALTKAELTEALAFYQSPAGRNYATSSHWHRSIASGTVVTEKPPNLTDEEYAAVGTFLATSAGSKLIHRESLRADKLEEDVMVRVRPLVIDRCLWAGSPK
jgi:TonB family protein